ncbi:MAG: hypothetical protein C0458_04290 [Methylobacterium sp.]|nr:hypothetical protein [Methylobacterium sp.]
MQRLALIMVMAALAGGARAMEDADGSVAKLSAADQAALDKALDISLFDGKSARVRDVRVGAPRKLCGWVNAKNSSGGYTGYRLFVAHLDDPAAIFDKRGPAVDDYDQPLDAKDRAVCIAAKHLDK